MLDCDLSSAGTRVGWQCWGLCHLCFDVGVAGSDLVLLSCMSLLIKRCDSGQGLGLIGSLLLP